MKDKLASGWSSYLALLPVIGAVLFFGVLAAFFGQIRIAAILIFLGLFAAASRVWAKASAKKLEVRVSGPVRGLFPGETAEFELEVHNNKALPVVWLEFFFPLSDDLCLVPEDARKPEEWEIGLLEEAGASAELVGEKKVSFLLWYERVRYVSTWTAQRRGVYSLEGWRMRTGDGFGLTQVERSVTGDGISRLAVYPRLVPVKTDLFLRNLWNAETGSKGVMEDPTVIRSTRDYMTSDSFKHINWRLAARGLPLSVNVYEDIMPRGLHFILDGESFSGPGGHREELEEALSILASELVRLQQASVQCGLSICRGAGCGAVNLHHGAALEEQLGALSAYKPMEPKWAGVHKELVAQLPEFDEGPICEEAQHTGRFYYITYQIDGLAERTLLHRLGSENVTILTYCDPEPYGDYEVVGLRGLREGDGNG